jgi:hypothetical protein
LQIGPSQQHDPFVPRASRSTPHSNLAKETTTRACVSNIGSTTQSVDSELTSNCFDLEHAASTGNLVECSVQSFKELEHLDRLQEHQSIEKIRIHSLKHKGAVAKTKKLLTSRTLDQAVNPLENVNNSASEHRCLATKIL